MAELFEALLGAVYLDGGLSEARRVYNFHWPFPDELLRAQSAPAVSSPLPPQSTLPDQEPLSSPEAETWLPEDDLKWEVTPRNLKYFEFP